jgi:hypothetical protein
MRRCPKTARRIPPEPESADAPATAAGGLFKSSADNEIGAQS